MKPHPYHQAIIDANKAARRPYYHQLTPRDARDMLRNGMAAAPPPTDPMVLRAVEDRLIDGPSGPIPLRLYHPPGEPLGTCVYFHGGGWVIGDLDLVDATCRRLASRAQCTLVSVDYRLAPENPYPQPLDDCWTALLWAGEIFPDPVLVAGDSAGGNLAAACAIRARDAGLALAGQLLAYPVTDHDFTTLSYEQIGDRNWLLSRADMQWFWDHYCPAGTDRTHPEVSPLRADDLSGLAPAFILAGQLDPLRDEALAYAARLAQAGVTVTCRCDSAMVHGYLAAAAAVPAAAEALADAVQWIKTRLGEPKRKDK